MEVSVSNCSQTFYNTDIFRGQVHTASLAVCTVLIIFVLLMGCIGNGIVLISALKWKKLRTNFDVLILNLAGADFLTCTCLSPIFLFLIFTDPPTPVMFCGSILFLGTISGMLSLLTLVFIALHRVSRVLGHSKRSLTLKRTGLILGVIWFLSLAIALGGTIHVTFDWDDQLHSCQAIINSPNRWKQNFVLFFLAPVIIVSFAIIICSYVIICRTVHTQTRITSDCSSGHKYTSDSSEKQTAAFIRDKIKIYGQERYCCSCSNQSFLNQENKALTLCLVVILTIGLCWGPLIISQFVELVTGESIILYQVKVCGIALVFLNSALDPYIYAQHIGQMKQRYNKGFQNIIKCVSFKASRTIVKIPGTGQYNLDTNSPKLGHNGNSSNTTPLVPSANVKQLIDQCNTTAPSPTTNTDHCSIYHHNLLLQYAREKSQFCSSCKHKQCLKPVHCEDQQFLENRTISNKERREIEHSCRYSNDSFYCKNMP